MSAPGPVRTVDLHVHSTESDGALTPEQLAQHASELGMETIALADHDSVAGVERCAEACAGLGIECIPAIELSARQGDTHVHMLGYFVDVDDPGLLATMELFRRQRVQRIMRIVTALRDAGYDLDMEPLERQAADASIGRLHVARALVDAGHVGTTRQAFDDLIGNGRPFHIEGERPTPAEALRIVLDAGGLPVVAHPALSHVEHLIEPLALAGMRGVEVYHGAHTAEQRAALAAITDEFALLSTGGSDYHGPEGPSGEMGSSEVPSEVVEALKAAAGRA